MYIYIHAYTSVIQLYIMYLTNLLVQTFCGKEEWSAAWVVLRIYLGTTLKQIQGSGLCYGDYGEVICQQMFGGYQILIK